MHKIRPRRTPFCFQTVKCNFKNSLVRTLLVNDSLWIGTKLFVWLLPSMSEGWQTRVRTHNLNKLSSPLGSFFSIPKKRLDNRRPRLREVPDNQHYLFTLFDVMITNYFSLHSYFVIQKDKFDWFLLSCLMLQKGISYHICITIILSTMVCSANSFTVYCTVILLVIYQ